MTTVIKKRGRPRKYPFALLEVGQTVLIPWPRDPETYKPLSLYPIINALCMYRSRTGRRFRWMNVQTGLEVTRLE